MTAGPPASTLWRFDRFELQPRERRLLDSGTPVSLGARTFDLLLALVARPGQLVTKGELLDIVWPGLVVEEANIAVQISTLRKVLGGDLIATIPGRGYRFAGSVEAVAPADAAQPRSAAPPAASPVAPVPLLGPALIARDDDLSTLATTLASPGCVTLVGPAGVGKTSLARALAARAAAGAVWVDLAALTAGDQIVPAVARALEMAAPDSDVAARLAAKVGARLLVLDNGEHVIDAAAALVARLLEAAPALHVLATSQLRLAIAGERVHRLEPLALPLGSDTLDLLHGAVAFFVDRVQAADHRFRAEPSQLPLLREICRRLDGLPLALEMAAARVPLLGLAGLARMLERRLALLTGGRRDAAARHRTLQAALDWSHDLLAADEQRLYRTCGVFTGGFTLDLLVAVAADTDDVTGAPADEPRWALIETLAQLVDRSLVAVDDGDPPRYRLLETMREDARQRLAAAGEESAMRGRHLSALAALGARGMAALDPRTAAAPVLRDALLAEHDNLREAIAWGCTQADPALRAHTLNLSTAVAGAATFTAWRLEAMQWLESCRPLAEGTEAPPVLLARWWVECARQWLMSRHEGARALAEQALVRAREAGVDTCEFQALSTLARAPGATVDELGALSVAMQALIDRHPEWGPARACTAAGVQAVYCRERRDHDGELRWRLRELELAQQTNNHAMATAVETNIVFALQVCERHDEALARARGLVARLGDSDSGNAAYAWLGLVTALRTLGHFGEFRAVLPRAARVLRLHDLPLLTPQCLLMLATEGRTADALRLLGHVRARFGAAAMSLTPEEEAEIQPLEPQARARLGDAVVDQLLQEGAAMDDNAIDALVLATPGGDAPAPAAGHTGRAAASGRL